MWEWVVGGECGEEGSDFVEDDKAEVVEGDDGFDLAFAKEEGYTDASIKKWRDSSMSLVKRMVTL